ncbi:MAG: undecaprenyl diphosphate synthase family protein, partial [Pseudomonadota bacterium]
MNQFSEIPPPDEAHGPHHVAVIMDGNGRWAQARGRPRLFGHHAGARRVREIVSACPDLGIKYLTMFAFSTENWKRTQTEVAGLMNLFRTSASISSCISRIKYRRNKFIKPATSV